jgi:hypothetical protein
MVHLLLMRPKGENEWKRRHGLEVWIMLKNKLQVFVSVAD